LYAYDRDRSVDLITRADGQTRDVEHDPAGRPSALTIARGRVTQRYDTTTGRATSTTAPDGGTLTHTYDGTLPTSTAWAGAVAGAVTRTYDPDFRVASSSVNGGPSVLFFYDDDGLLTAAGNLVVSRHAGNGFVTGTSLGTVTDTRGYDQFGDPIAYTAAIGGEATYATTLVRDKLGRIQTRTETIDGQTQTFQYAYDTLGRLTDVSRDGIAIRAYTYDLNGNRLTAGGVSATYDAQDRLLQSGATTYTYSADGELQRKTSAGQTTSYGYDELGNLLQVILPGGPQIDYVIDAQNRRVGKRVDGTLVQGFLYDDQRRPVAELAGDNGLVSRFVYGVSTTVPDFMIRGGVTYRILSDHLGSPRMVIDVATGAVVQRMDYDEFGVVVRDTNPGFQPFGFAGGLYDRDTRLTRFGARDYDAEVGRWTVRDPIRFDGGFNLYAYVANDPVNRIDPTGLVDPERLGLPNESSKEAAEKAWREYSERQARLRAERLAAEAARRVSWLDKLKGLFRGAAKCDVNFLDPRYACTVDPYAFEGTGICPPPPPRFM
jgi:RHS repeat-associated protein